MKKTESGQAVLSSAGESAAMQLLMMGAWSLLGFMLPGALLYGGLSPFGVGLAASIGGPMALPVYLAVAAGYIIRHGITFSVRYVVAVTAAAGVRWVLGGMPRLTGHRLFSPVNAGGSLLVSGLATLGFSGAGWYPVLLIGIESILAAGFACLATCVYSLRPGAAEQHTEFEKGALACVAAVALLAASSVHFGGIAPGRILAASAVLLAARFSGTAGGMIGVLMGTLLALSGEHPILTAVSFAAGGMLAGVLTRRGKIAQAAGFFLLSVAVALIGRDKTEAAVQVYEAGAAVLLFLALPHILEDKIHALAGQAQPLAAGSEGVRMTLAGQLDLTAKAMREVAGTVDAVSGKMAWLGLPDIGTMYRGVTQEVCRSCNRYKDCWNDGFSATMDGFNRLTTVLREKGKAAAKDVDAPLNQCRYLDRVLTRVNEGYREQLIRESAFRRLADLRKTVTEQFSGMADVLGDLSLSVSQQRRSDPETARRVAALCRRYGLTQVCVACEIGEQQRMSIYIQASDREADWQQESFLREMRILCARRFLPPQSERIAAHTVRLQLEEKPRYAVQIACAQLSCSGEKYCGDAVEHFYRRDGSFITVLSDGMGSGGRAAVDGAMAAGLTARLMQAGLQADSVLRLVNSALMAKGGDESLATLDVVLINPYTGQMSCCKAGAAASFLRSAQGICSIEKACLPIGILREISFEESRFILVDKDVLLLVSDGVLSTGYGWVEQLLEEFDPSAGRLQTLVSAVARQARQKQKQDHEDDITVVALRLAAER